ncbi:MAG: redoxin domain-containing protein [Planctomycetota bacterium]
MFRIFLIFNLLLTSLYAQEPENPLIGKQSTEVKDLTSNLTWMNRAFNEKLTSFKDFNGKVVVLEFSAVWCGPCIASIPHLIEIQTQLSPVGLRVISIFSPDNDPPLEGIIKEFKINYDVARDNKNELFTGYSIQSFPQVYVLNSTGKVAWHGHPMELDKGYLVELLLANIPIGSNEILKTAKKELIEGNILAARTTLETAPPETALAADQLSQFIQNLAKGTVASFPDFAQLSEMEKFAYAENYENLLVRFGEIDAFKSLKANVAALKKSETYEFQKALYEQEKAEKEKQAAMEEAAQAEWNNLVETMILPAESAGETDFKKFIPQFKAFLEKYKGTQMAEQVENILRTRKILE